ncbi:MAG TPA: DUF5690 family protein [Longimicrobiales bacterium]|nr:DUF5690 family protein [Longimicrobiales bacterium]
MAPAGPSPRQNLNPPQPAPEARTTSWRQILVLMAASFMAYFSMYAFRKPINATEFAGLSLGGSGVDLKTALLVGQLVGYALSKYLGIVVCSSVSREAQGRTLVALVVTAEAALLAFAVAPGGWKVAAMFVNGLPLGMVWGLVVRYLEGRRASEPLLAFLSISYIVASGVMKDVGLWVMHGRGVPEVWMPAVVGALFLAPFVVSVRVLESTAEPDALDRAERVPRREMTGRERTAFLRRYGVGLTPLIAMFFFLTAYRDFRDNYGVEIFGALGYTGVPGLFVRSELPAAAAVMGALAALGLVRSNRRGLMAVYALMVAGLAVVGASTLLFRAGGSSGMTWMVAVGVGSYLAYVPVGAVLFDRFVAAGGTAGTAVFGIYVADAVGYTGSVLVQLYRDLAQGGTTRLAFFETFSLHLAGWGSLLLVLSALLVWRALPRGDAVRDRVTSEEPA